MSLKHLSCYVSEFAGRHNIRPLDAEEQMSATAQGIVGKRLPYSELIARRCSSVRRQRGQPDLIPIQIDHTPEFSPQA